MPSLVVGWPEDDVIEESQVGGCRDKTDSPLFRGILESILGILIKGV